VDRVTAPATRSGGQAPKKRSWRAQLAVGVTACAVLAQGSVSGAQSQTAEAPTTPVHATWADLSPGRMYSSPAFAVDPKDPKRVVAGFADLFTRRCGLLRSTDGAATWRLAEGSPALASYPFCSQSQGSQIQAPVAFGRSGTLYMALGGWDDPDGARTGGAILLARSDDLGDTWETVEVYSARGKTGEDAENVRPIHSLAVDTRTGGDDLIYVTYNLARPGRTAPNQSPTVPIVAVSRDGGRTFGTPVDLSSGVFEAQALRDQAFTASTTTTLAPNASTTTTTAPAAGSLRATPNQAANFGGSTSRFHVQARVDGQGNAYVHWMSGSANLTPAPPTAHFISRSSDGGQTWTTEMAIPFDYENAAPRFEVSPGGVLHMVYHRNPDGINSNGEVFHRASSDGGRTWTEPKVLTDDNPADYFGQYFPNISVAPNGRVDVVWWDTRDDVGIRSNDVYYTYSNDDGATWSANRRITDRSVDRRYGVWGINYDINSPPGVGSVNQYAIFGWDDTRNTDVSNPEYASGFGAGTQDIYISAVQFETLGGGTSSTAQIVLAATAGLVAVGLALLLVTMAGKRKSGPSPARKTAPKEEAAPVT
jgi:hypothetical protein